MRVARCPREMYTCVMLTISAWMFLTREKLRA
jgi:hypothetical protein